MTFSGAIEKIGLQIGSQLVKGGAIQQGTGMAVVRPGGVIHFLTGTNSTGLASPGDYWESVTSVFFAQNGRDNLGGRAGVNTAFTTCRLLQGGKSSQPHARFGPCSFAPKICELLPTARFAGARNCTPAPKIYVAGPR